MEESVRVRESMTAAREQRLLQAMARRLPDGVTPDHLTVLGVVAALGVAAGYALSTSSPHWLWLASAMLALNWFGDSLDGTVARLRGIERPRYGYYLDHSVDAFTTAVIGISVALSPYVALPIGFVIAVLYLMMSINVYLEAAVFRVYRMDYGPIGPTEARLLLIIANTLLILGTAGLDMDPAGIEAVVSRVAPVLLLIMFLLLVWRFGRNLRRLAREEPPE